MIPDGPLSQLFRGLAFFQGAEHLPQDVPVRLSPIRDWAEQSGLIRGPDRILTSRRVAAFSGACSPEDDLLVGIVIAGEPAPRDYVEYPYLPVRSLVRRGGVVTLWSWKVKPAEVKFEFTIAGCAERFLSDSTGVHVVPKFAHALCRLADAYPVRTLPDGSRHIAVGGEANAKFHKSGRLFEVALAWIKATEPLA